MAPPDWFWPEVVEARALEVTLAVGGGPEGPAEQEEEPLWAWLVLLW